MATATARRPRTRKPALSPRVIQEQLNNARGEGTIHIWTHATALPHACRVYSNMTGEHAQRRHLQGIADRVAISHKIACELNNSSIGGYNLFVALDQQPGG